VFPFQTLNDFREPILHVGEREMLRGDHSHKYGYIVPSQQLAAQAVHGGN
jgi:hypothetical protein